jgi:prepilin-type N-terminal cleavage/methylation domain-containing protein
MIRGFTLLEVLVTLALLGLLGAVTGLSVASLRPEDASLALRAIERARSDAVGTGRAVVVRHDGRQVRFLPDGSSSGGWLLIDGTWFSVSPLTGVVRVLQ